MTDRSDDLAAMRLKAAAYLQDQGRAANVYTLDASNAVFLAVDMQNFVCDPAPGRVLPNIGGVVTQINLMADYCHMHGMPVIWLRQCFSRSNGADDLGLYGFFHKQPLDDGMFNQEQATEIYPAMHLDPGQDLVVIKNRYSAFAPGSSRLESLLSAISKTQIIMGGVATNVCVESTTRDAMQRGYQVTVLSNATTAFDKLVHEISLLNIRLFFGDVRSVQEVIRELEA